MKRQHVIRSLKRLTEFRSLRISQGHYLSDKTKQVLICVDDAISELSPEMEMLKKLAEAIEKSHRKVVIKSAFDASLETLLQETSYEVLIFLSDTINKSSKPICSIQMPLIFSSTATELLHQPALKRKLWTEIQKVLGLS